MVLAEDAVSQGSGNADSQRKVRSSGWGGQGGLYPRDFGCVHAHPAYWRASASYRPLRAVWAVAPGHSGVARDRKNPLRRSAKKAAHQLQGIHQMTTAK